MAEPNKTHIRKWVDALRSGAYKQTRLKLRGKASDGSGEVGYCCLGVACEISGLGSFEDGYSTFSDHDEPWSGPGSRSDSQLTKAVQDWLGLDHPDPQLGRRRASGWNDDEHKSFTEIADLIEAKYL